MLPVKTHQSLELVKKESLILLGLRNLEETPVDKDRLNNFVIAENVIHLLSDGGNL